MIKQTAIEPNALSRTSQGFSSGEVQSSVGFEKYTARFEYHRALLNPSLENGKNLELNFELKYD